MEEREEYNTLFHTVYLIICTLMGALLAAASIILGWGVRPVIAVFIAIVVCWSLHISKLVSSDARMVTYTMIAAGFMFYYGSGPVSVGDLPLVILTFIFLSSLSRGKASIYILAATFPLELVFLFSSGRLSLPVDPAMLMRLILGALSIICAVAIGLFHQKSLKIDEENKDILERQVANSREDNKVFLANISHELRTPINAVNGMSQVILKKSLDAELYGNMDSIYKAGRRLADDISNILDYSEILTGKLQLSENDYEIMSVVNDISTGLIWYDEYNQLEIGIDIKQDVPAVFYGDEGKLRRILALLMEYSLKGKSTGGIYLGVSSKTYENGTNLCIDILNVGKSLSKEEIAEIYRSFDTDRNMVHGNNGLDLGLVVVHGIVSKMGGFVKIDSPDKETTRIRVAFPQKVVTSRPVLVLEDADKYKVACYFNKDKYVYPQIAEIYGRMLHNFSDIMGLEIHVAESLSRLKSIVASRAISHVFVAEWEYRMDPAYFEELSNRIHMSIFAGKNFTLPASSKINIFRKPIYTLSIVNNLKLMAPGSQDFKADSSQEKISFMSMRALVVDDDALNLRVAREILQTLDMNVQTVASGEAAIERCNFEEFDIIFMDYMMPGMNGIECMKKIHAIRSARYKVIPIVALTANAVSSARDMFLGEGFDEFIPKPIEISRMARVIKKFYKGAK